MVPRRLSNEQEQGGIGEQQIATRLREYGWLTTQVTPDMGEDLFVRIYDQGISSGLTFYAQVKSTRNLEGLQIRGGQISQAIDVKDLEHWNASATPVFIIVWDVYKREGCWISISDTITELCERNQEWRHQGKVQVHIPVSNRTDDEGLRRIRKLVADYYYPSTSKDKSLDFKVGLVFPDTPEGKVALEAVQRFYQVGDPLEVDGQFIEKFEFPDWYTRLYGPFSPGYLRFIPAAQQTSVPVRFDLMLKNGTRSILHYVDLHVTKAGFEEVTLSNEHQNLPLHFKLVVPLIESRALRMQVKLASPGANVIDTRDALTFLNAIIDGAALLVTILATGEVVELGFPAQVQSNVIPELDFARHVEQLCMIQQKTRCSLALADWQISTEDAHVIRDLAQICEHGRVDLQGRTMTIDLKRGGLDILRGVLSTRETSRLVMTQSDTSVSLLGTDVPLGPSTWDMTVTPQISLDELEKAMTRMGPDDGMKINFLVLSGEAEYAHWLQANAPNST